MKRVLMGLALTIATLAAAALPAAAQNYRIQPGDVLKIEVVEDPGLNRDVLVLPDGRISLPLAGSVRAAGQTLEQVQRTLATQLGPNFNAPPNVFVSIASLRPQQAPTGPAEAPVIEVFVLGEAANKGKLSIEPGSTLLEAFAQMGGFTPFAATKRIQLRRTEGGVEKIYRLNYDAILSGASKNGLLGLRDGDVIVVPQRGLFE